MKFQPGQSGNPAGRPVGAKGRASVLRDSLDAEVPEILKAVVQQAKDGDIQAARLILERCLPPIRAVGPKVEAPLEHFAEGDLKVRAEAVVTALGRGDISTDVAQSLMGALNVQAGILETSDLAERISKLEEALNVRSNP